MRRSRNLVPDDFFKYMGIRRSTTAAATESAREETGEINILSPRYDSRITEGIMPTVVAARYPLNRTAEIPAA